MRYLLLMTSLLLAACGGNSQDGGDPLTYERLHCPAVGYNSIFEEPLREVIRDQHRFTEVYLGVDDRLPDEVPDIDFSEKQVIVITDGFRPSSGYSVNMGSITQKDGELRVRYLREKPGDNCTVPTVVTYPYCLVVTDRRDMPARFEAHESIHNCE